MQGKSKTARELADNGKYGVAPYGGSVYHEQTDGTKRCPAKYNYYGGGRGKVTVGQQILTIYNSEDVFRPCATCFKKRSPKFVTRTQYYMVGEGKKLDLGSMFLTEAANDEDALQAYLRFTGDSLEIPTKRITISVYSVSLDAQFTTNAWVRV